MRHHRSERFRRRPGISVRTSSGSDDLGALYELIAEHVVAVGMGVDELVDVARGRNGVAHRLEHLRGKRQVEQRVDKQSLVAVRDQSRVAPPPRAVRLQIGETTATEIMQSLRIMPPAH